MSTTHLNLYVVKNAKGLNSFETLCATMFGSKKGKFNQKIQLTHLREMSIYMSAVTSMEEAIFSAITLYLKDLGDSDADRKLFRTAMYLLSEAIAEYSSRNELIKKRGAVLVLNSLLGKELGQKGGSAKQFLIWRTLGSIVHAHNAQAKQLDAVKEASTGTLPIRNSEIETFVISRLHSTFEGLQYPVKQKKSVLFGEDKEFFPKMLLWSSVMSALARCEDVLPKKCWSNLSCGLTCTHYTPLVQHSFRVLWNSAKLIKDDATQEAFMTALLADRDGSKGKEQLNIADVLCCSYLIRTLSALARNCADLQNVDPASQNNPCSERLRTLINLFIRSLRFLQANNVKIVTEMVNALLDKDDGSKIICMITQISQQQKREKGAKTKRPNVITLVTEALLTNLQAVESIEAIHLPPLLRACETLGRFLVHRPYFSPRQQQKDGDTIASLWTTLRRHYRSCLMPKDDCVGSNAQRAGRALAWRQQRAQAGSAGGTNCVGYNGNNCWSWPAESPSAATAAISHSPHILCALLRAQIWMAPDQRYCPKEHALLWNAFSESLLSSWQLIITTLSGQFDILSTLMSLLSQYFARVQASILVAPPSKPAASAAKGNFLDFGEVSSGGAADVTEIGIFYQPVYVDVLIALSEQLVTATRSGIAVTFLQSVWKWLATLTSARVHKQQAALQAKKDLAAQAAGNSAFPASDAPKTVIIAHALHADKVLLQSIARMTVVAQQHHLHSVSVPALMGCPSIEEPAKVMNNLYSTGLWHLADNALLCFSLTLETPPEAQDLTNAVDSTMCCNFPSRAAALQMVVKILSQAAKQSEQPNVRNTAILGLVKVSCQLLLSAEDAASKIDKDAVTTVLHSIFRECALIYLSGFGYTLDLAYRNVLSQLLSGAAPVPVGSKHTDLVVELMSHVFALPSTVDSARGINVLPSIFTILLSTMKMLCAQLQSKSTSVTEQFRTSVTVHASLQRNKFVLLVLPPPAAEADDEVQSEDEAEAEVRAENVPAEKVENTQTAGHTTATANSDFMGFDDDLLGGWASSTPVLAPSKPTKPAVQANTSGGLLDMGDMWLLDMPLEPTKSSAVPTLAKTPSTGANNNVFDIFGSNEPLFPSMSDTKPAAVPFIAPPMVKRTSYVRNIYDEDDGTTAAATSPATASAVPLAFPNDAFAPTPASFVATTSPTATAAAVGFGESSASQGFDWPGSTASAPVADSDPFGSAFFASGSPSAAPMVQAPAPVADRRRASGNGSSGLDAWPTATVNGGQTGFDMPSHSSDSFASALPSESFATGSGVTNSSWGATLAAPPTAATVTLSPPSLADSGFDALPGFGGTTPPAKSAGSTDARRASVGPMAAPKEAPVSAEVAAAAAARRANRRASTGAGATAQGKAGAAVDPFASTTGLLVPANKAVAEPPADVWGSGASVPAAAVAAFPTTADPFFSSSAPTTASQSAAWPSAPLTMPANGFTATDAFATTTSPSSAAVGGFQVTSSDFSPSTPNSAYANAPTHAYPPNPNYPQSYGAPYDPSAAGAYGTNYAYPPPGGYAAPAYPNANYGTAPYPDPNYPPAGYAPQPNYANGQVPYAPPAGYPSAYPNYSQPQYGAAPGYPAAPAGQYDPAYANYGYPPAPGSAGATPAAYYPPYNQAPTGHAHSGYPPQQYTYPPPS